MIDIYTEKKDSKDWILQNDLYFNLNTANEKMSQKEVDLLFNEAQQLVYSLTLNHGLILEIIEKLWKRVR